MTAQAQSGFDFSRLDEATIAALRFQGAERIQTDQLELYVAPNFLSAEECAIFVQMIDADCRPSTTVNTGADASFRTSHTCDFSARLAVVDVLDIRLSLLLGIAPEKGENIQGQRYHVGQEFKAHTDYFDADGPDTHAHTRVAGNRTWTAMAYLNDVEEGGETYFPHLQAGFRPQRGTLLAWNNQRRDGRLNPKTLHHGMPVIRGEKFVITKWYRERSIRG